MQFSIDMAAPGKARARAGRNGHYTPAKTRAAEKRIRDEYKLARGAFIDGPVRLFVEAHYAPPKSWSGKRRRSALGTWKETKPDSDNVFKLIADALNGVAYPDDARIVDIAISKVWAEENRVIITVEPA